MNQESGDASRFLENARCFASTRRHNFGAVCTSGGGGARLDCRVDVCLRKNDTRPFTDNMQILIAISSWKIDR